MLDSFDFVGVSLCGVGGVFSIRFSALSRRSASFCDTFLSLFSTEKRLSGLIFSANRDDRPTNPPTIPLRTTAICRRARLNQPVCEALLRAGALACPLWVPGGSSRRDPLVRRTWGRLGAGPGLPIHGPESSILSASTVRTFDIRTFCRAGIKLFSVSLVSLLQSESQRTHHLGAVQLCIQSP